MSMSEDEIALDYMPRKSSTLAAKATSLRVQ